jgi:hypothetical protein
MTKAITTTKKEITTQSLSSGSVQAATENELERRRDRPPWPVFAAFLLISIAILALLAWSLSSARILFLELLVAAGATSVGGLLGFLFGMPRGPVDAPAAEAEDQAVMTVSYRPSNNLEQVSDWLTKILIGVGLVELSQLRGTLSALGRSVETSVAGVPAGTNVVTQVVVLTFIVMGFLASFLWTRISYGPLQTLVDNDVLNSLRGKLIDSQSALKAEKETRKKAVSVAQSMSKGEIAIPATPPLKGATAARREASPNLQNWLPDIQEKITKFAASPATWNTDPGAKIFPNARREANGRRLEAEILIDLGDTLVINLRVRRVSGEPLRGTVAFLLHPTFTEPIMYTAAFDDVAEIKISSGGWFTVVVVADKGGTILAFDLREVPNAPSWFKEN